MVDLVLRNLIWFSLGWFAMHFVIDVVRTWRRKRHESRSRARDHQGPTAITSAVNSASGVGKSFDAGLAASISANASSLHASIAAFARALAAFGAVGTGMMHPVADVEEREQDEPITGWKLVTVLWDGSLQSSTMNQPVEVDWTKAICIHKPLRETSHLPWWRMHAVAKRKRHNKRNGGHEAPDIECRCGMYAYVKQTGHHPNLLTPLAEVELAGTIMSDGTVMRATYQRVMALEFSAGCYLCARPAEGGCRSKRERSVRSHIRSCCRGCANQHHWDFFTWDELTELTGVEVKRYVDPDPDGSASLLKQKEFPATIIPKYGPVNPNPAQPHVLMPNGGILKLPADTDVNKFARDLDGANTLRAGEYVDVVDGLGRIVRRVHGTNP